MMGDSSDANNGVDGEGREENTWENVGHAVGLVGHAADRAVEAAGHAIAGGADYLLGDEQGGHDHLEQAFDRAGYAQASLTRASWDLGADMSVDSDYSWRPKHYSIDPMNDTSNDATYDTSGEWSGDSSDTSDSSSADDPGNDDDPAASDATQDIGDMDPITD